jgi:hypothetical protein
MKALNGGFHVIDGKISMSTPLMADMIRRAGHSIKIIEWTTEKCVIIGRRKDNDDSVKVEFTKEDAKLAELLGKSNWRKYPKAMLYNRAMSMLSRVLFPDVTGNPYCEDEVDDIKHIPNHKAEETDPEAPMTIDMVTGEMIKEKSPESSPKNESKLTESQCATLDSYFIEEMSALEDIKAKYGLNDAYDLHPNDFDHVINILKARKEVRDAKVAVV